MEKIEQMLSENEVFIKSKNSKNDKLVNVSDVIKWLFEHTKKQVEKYDKLEEAFDIKTEVHDKLNRDYVALRDKCREPN